MDGSDDGYARFSAPPRLTKVATNNANTRRPQWPKSSAGFAVSSRSGGYLLISNLTLEDLACCVAGHRRGHNFDDPRNLEAGHSARQV